MELNTLYNLENSTPLSSTVILVPGVPNPYGPSKWVQESAATPLDGISTVGGLWTFAEGIFILVFGANIIYFAFGTYETSLYVLQGSSVIHQADDHFLPWESCICFSAGVSLSNGMRTFPPYTTRAATLATNQQGLSHSSGNVWWILIPLRVTRARIPSVPI
jgi:hypothetical protein